MRITLIALVSVIGLGSLRLYASSGQIQPDLPKKLVLTVKKSTDRTKELPGSHVYVADLLNNSDQIVKLEAIQMPGGYAWFGKVLCLWSPSLEHSTARMDEAMGVRGGPEPTFRRCRSKSRRAQGSLQHAPTRAGGCGWSVRPFQVADALATELFIPPGFKTVFNRRQRAGTGWHLSRESLTRY